ncbi:unnamed protein product [Ectocarpus sp. 6 AP-2014]
MVGRRRIPVRLVFGFLFLTRKEGCVGFVANLAAQQQPQQHRSCWGQEDHHHHAHHEAAATATAAAAAATATRTAAHRAIASRTALHATGFGPPPPPPKRPPPRRASTPHPSTNAYYPSDDDEQDSSSSSSSEPPPDGDDGEPFPRLDDARKAEEPRGIGTLFESEDEVIRELSSEEYTDLLRDWAPIASFASVEAIDAKVKEEAACILTVLRGMAEWQPKRNSDYTKVGSKWSFGAPIGAIKGGQVDALACLQVSEDDGVVVEWICGNPVTLGIPGNAVEWLAKGIHALCGKRLDLPVTISPKARGEGGEGGQGAAGGDGSGGYGGRGGGGGGKGKRNSGGGGGKKKSGSKKRR